MRKNYYTATEAADVLHLKYHTFLARVHKGMYDYEWWGHSKVFKKRYIDSIAYVQKRNEDNHATDR